MISTVRNLIEVSEDEETPAEAARREGRLVHDEIGDEWVEIEPLPCRHSHVKIFADGQIVCTRCDKRQR